MNRLVGKTALIIDGTLGTGFRTAKRFSEEGAAVNIAGRTEDRVDPADRKNLTNARHQRPSWTPTPAPRDDEETS